MWKIIAIYINIIVSVNIKHKKRKGQIVMFGNYRFVPGFDEIIFLIYEWIFIGNYVQIFKLKDLNLPFKPPH